MMTLSSVHTGRPNTANIQQNWATMSWQLRLRFNHFVWRMFVCRSVQLWQPAVLSLWTTIWDVVFYSRHCHMVNAEHEHRSSGSSNSCVPFALCWRHQLSVWNVSSRSCVQLLVRGGASCLLCEVVCQQDETRRHCVYRYCRDGRYWLKILSRYIVVFIAMTI